MTEANQKLLYEAYLASGDTAKANEVLSRYPQFKGAELDVDFSSMSKGELRTYAENAGVDAKDAKTKDDLIVLLENKSDEVK